MARVVVREPETGERSAPPLVASEGADSPVLADGRVHPGLTAEGYDVWPGGALHRGPTPALVGVADTFPPSDHWLPEPGVPVRQFCDAIAVSSGS
jgi:hypothetical protein